MTYKYEKFFSLYPNGVKCSKEPVEDPKYGFDEKKVVEDLKYGFDEKTNVDKNLMLEPRLPHEEFASCEYNQNQSVFLTQKQIQELKFEKCKANLRLEEYRARQQIKQSFAKCISIDENGIMTGSNNGSHQTNQNNDSKIIAHFIESKGLVKDINRNSKEGYDIYAYNPIMNRSEPIAKDKLKADFEDVIDTLRADNIITKTKRDRLFSTMLYQIKYKEELIQEDRLENLSQYSVALKNGFYDLHENKFVPKTDCKKRIFNKTSLPINFLSTDTEPEYFNRFLKCILGEENIRGMYEFMGAMFSGIPLIKKIFVMQGVSNGGKSRLAKIIARCFYQCDVVELEKLTDLKDDINLDRALLVYIDELSDKKLNPSQVSKLKQLSNGNKQVKLIVTTNHPVTSESDGSIDNALLNRLAVIAFSEIMDNSDADIAAYEDVHWESESDAVVSKSLKEFNQVLARSQSISNLEFSCTYKLNGCVEKKVFPNELDSSIDSKSVQEILQKQAMRPMPCNNTEIINQLVEIIDTINPEMTSTNLLSLFNQLEFKPKDVCNLGKLLKTCFGDKLRIARKKGKVCYNLKYREPTKS